jgi:hypothetical protein
VHGVQPFGDPSHHAVLEALRGLAQARAPEMRIELPKGSGLDDDRPVDYGEQIGGERGVGLEAEKHIPAAGPGRVKVRRLQVWDGGAGEPDFAVAERAMVGTQPSIGRRRWPSSGTSRARAMPTRCC